MLELRPAALAEFSLLPAIEAASDTLLTQIAGQRLTRPMPSGAGAAEFAAALHIMVAGRPAVAFVRLEEVDGQAHLEQLSVQPDFARHGIGRALIHAAVAWARECGYHAMTLTTFADVPFNAPFYASCGFAVDSSPGPELLRRRNHERELGLDALGDRVVMRISLDGKYPQA
ncbi:GNAT family N-acetyltransferase [Paenarthrobacter sp. PH39-S1]|uniref:GNAT family N-acetyltransferase n=1 Tax=Paenarthrobacter sp. PH39-S1 TaxID=3046204 RepID=UPI0024B9FE90|nr:GNAT family N-acetyltransferase [Paenarthrobacter sp. PH39-S1]MDJ0357576.1 GNAT family N-acetyltransferase [Paenarthrobacter sp. PH39-S1]